MLQVVGVKMAVWSTKANETLCALSGRLPAMADRSWNPQAGRSYADYQIRVASTTRVLAALLGRSTAAPPPLPPPPAPLPAPAALGFLGLQGECRDKSGGFGTRLEHNGPTTIAECQAMCANEGTKCDAYDFGDGSWCGIWGRGYTPGDNVTFGRLKWTWATGPNAAKDLPVCHGDKKSSNVCYVRQALHCAGGGGAGVPPPPVGCVAGCDAATCWAGGLH
jgi:hypothetical protein